MWGDCGYFTYNVRWNQAKLRSTCLLHRGQKLSGKWQKAGPTNCPILETCHLPIVLVRVSIFLHKHYDRSSRAYLLHGSGFLCLCDGKNTAFVAKAAEDKSEKHQVTGTRLTLWVSLERGDLSGSGQTLSQMWWPMYAEDALYPDGGGTEYRYH